MVYIILTIPKKVYKQLGCMNKKNKGLNTLIKILTIILLIALLALTAIKIYKALNVGGNETDNTTDVIGGNQIGEDNSNDNDDDTPTEESNSSNDNANISDNDSITGKLITTGDASAVDFYEKHYSYNESFSIYNMFPGDGFIKGYAVSIHHIGPIDVNFYVDVQSGYEKLANALMVRMTYNGSVIHTGKLIDFDYTARINSNTETTDILDYQVEVYLPTSVTEEYANLECFADFLWRADEVIDEEGNEGKLVPVVNTGVSGVIQKVVNNNWIFYPLMIVILLTIYLLSRRNIHEDR